MNNPANLMYSKSHEWVEFTGETTAKIGLTDFAQTSLGGVVFVNLPEKGDMLVYGESLGEVESVKAVADIISPLSGTVAAVNEDLLTAPEGINKAPYAAWLVEVSDITEREELLDAAMYTAFCEEST